MIPIHKDPTFGCMAVDVHVQVESRVALPRFDITRICSRRMRCRDLADGTVKLVGKVKVRVLAKDDVNGRRWRHQCRYRHGRRKRLRWLGWWGQGISFRYWLLLLVIAIPKCQPSPGRSH